MVNALQPKFHNDLFFKWVIASLFFPLIWYFLYN